MITVTRLNGPAFALNPDLIERIEATPDTVIHLVGGTNYVVVESVDEIVARVRESRAAVIALSHLIDQRTDGGPNLRVVPSGEPEDSDGRGQKGEAEEGEGAEEKKKGGAKKLIIKIVPLCSSRSWSRR